MTSLEILIENCQASASGFRYPARRYLEYAYRTEYNDYIFEHEKRILRKRVFMLVPKGPRIIRYVT